MQNRQLLSDITISILTGINTIIHKVNPDIVLVHGDTTTTFTVRAGHVHRELSWAAERETANKILGNHDRIHLIEPVKNPSILPSVFCWITQKYMNK